MVMRRRTTRGSSGGAATAGDSVARSNARPVSTAIRRSGFTIVHEGDGIVVVHEGSPARLLGVLAQVVGHFPVGGAGGAAVIPGEVEGSARGLLHPGHGGLVGALVVPVPEGAPGDEQGGGQGGRPPGD